MLSFVPASFATFLFNPERQPQLLVLPETILLLLIGLVFPHMEQWQSQNVSVPFSGRFSESPTTVRYPNSSPIIDKSTFLGKTNP